MEVLKGHWTQILLTHGTRCLTSWWLQTRKEILSRCIMTQELNQTKERLIQLTSCSKYGTKLDQIVAETLSNLMESQQLGAYRMIIIPIIIIKTKKCRIKEHTILHRTTMVGAQEMLHITTQTQGKVIKRSHLTSSRMTWTRGHQCTSQDHHSTILRTSRRKSMKLW
jgi:hypothetical protein